MPTFQQLWRSHPTISGDDPPCTTDGKPNFSDQCAIRVGVALAQNGVNTGAMRGVARCWFHNAAAGHILRAEELARALAGTSIAGMGERRKVEPGKFAAELADQTGILFFKDYWRRGGESFHNRSGDHVDLWNGSRLTDWTTWIRIQISVSWEGTWSDYGQSKEIWFWPVK